MGSADTAIYSLIYVSPEFPFFLGLCSLHRTFDVLQLRVCFSPSHSFIHSFIHSINTDMLHGSKCVLSQPPGPHAIYDVQAWKPAHAPFKKEVHNDIIHRYFLPGSDIQTPPLTGDTYRTSRWQVLGFHNLRANRLKESTSTPN